MIDICLKVNVKFGIIKIYTLIFVGTYDPQFGVYVGFEVNPKGFTHFVINGHRFFKKQTNEEKIYWNCCEHNNSRY